MMQRSGNRGVAAPSPRSASVSSASGIVFTISRLLGGSSTLSLLVGSDANLTLDVTTGAITANAAISAGASQSAFVRESAGRVAVEYPLTLTGVAARPSAPTFTVQPSIVGTAQVGQVLSGMDGTISDGAVVSRRWLLGAAVVSTAQTYVATAAGALVFEVTAEGPGGRTVAAATVSVAPAQSAIARPGQIGFNTITDNGQGFSSFIFLNRMKCGSANGMWSNGAPLSQYGYPTALGSGHSDTGLYVSLRRPTSGTTTYVFRHNGSADLNWDFVLTSGITKTDVSNPNRVLLTVGPAPAGDLPLVVLRAATTWPDYRPNNPIESRDGIAIYRLQDEAAYLAGKQFDPDALAAYRKSYGTRWMDVSQVNAGGARGINDRTPVGYCVYNEAAPFSMPLEVMIDLCNEADQNIWINVFPQADAAHRTWMFETLRDRFSPTRLIFAETGNEVWNHDLTPNNNNFAAATAQAVNPAWSAEEGYGILAAQTAIRIREVFGASHDARVINVFARQSSATYGMEKAAIGVESTGHKVRDLFPAMAIGFYTGGPVQTLGGTTSNPQQRQQLLDEVERYEATGSDFASRTVRQELVDHMRHGNAIAGWPNVNTLDLLVNDIDGGKAFCKAQGIRHLIGYEGQDPHCSITAMGAMNGLRANTMMDAWHNDVRVAGIQDGSYERDKFAMMRARGMTAHFILTDFGGVNQFGCWRSKETAVSADTPLWFFYDWYNVHAPDAVAFEINLLGGAAMTVGAAVTKTVASYGGTFPAQPVVLASGALPPGVALDGNGNLTGTPTKDGNFAVTFTATDASGNTVALNTVFAVAPAPPVRTFRYARVVISENAASRNFTVQPRDLYFVRADGTIDRPAWTGPRDDSDHSRTFAIPEIGDGDPNTLCQSPGIYEVGPLDYRGALPAVGSYAQFGWYPTSAGGAPGKWRIYVSKDPIVPGENDGTLVLDLNEPDPSHWTDNTPRLFAIA